MNHKRRPWTSAEETLLRDQSSNGGDVLKLATTLNRTLGSVLAKMFDMGLQVPRKQPGKGELPPPCKRIPTPR